MISFVRDIQACHRLGKTSQVMLKHQQHLFDNSQIWGGLYSLVVSSGAVAGVLDCYKKIFLPNSPPFGVRLLLKCDLYLNKYDILTKRSID